MLFIVSNLTVFKRVASISPDNVIEEQHIKLKSSDRLVVLEMLLEALYFYTIKMAKFGIVENCLLPVIYRC